MTLTSNISNSVIDWCPRYSVWRNPKTGGTVMCLGKLYDPEADEITLVRVVDLQTENETEVRWSDWRDWYESGYIVRTRLSFNP